MHSAKTANSRSPTHIKLNNSRFFILLVAIPDQIREEDDDNTGVQVETKLFLVRQSLIEGSPSQSMQFPSISTNISANPLCDENYPNTLPSSVSPNFPCIGCKLCMTSDG